MDSIKTWDPETSPAEAAAAVTGEVETHDDDGPVRIYVARDTLGRGLVFLNLDYNTAEDIADIEADFEKGWSDRGGASVEVPMSRETARALGEYLLAAGTA